MRTRGRILHALLVEDNPAHANLVQETLAEMDSKIHLDIVEDGVQALEYLRRQGRHAGVQRPDLVLLDLNLPKKNGREVLYEVKSDPELRQIPVVILSTSDAEDDIRQCYDLQAACYLVKPFDLDDFMALMRSLDAFWTGHVRFPPKTAHPFIQK